MASTIEEYVTEREIPFLMHFTRISNLDGILQNGLVPRDVLVRGGYVDFNDAYRLDGTNAVCVTIAYPNYKMFFRLRQQNVGVDWVILAIYPAALWMLRCAFCSTNAASNVVTALPLANRCDLGSFQSMYADWEGKKRGTLQIPDSYPTNPQAEVLMLNGVPRNYIYAVVVLNWDKKAELEARYPGLDVRVNAGYFRGRMDYAHWK